MLGMMQGIHHVLVLRSIPCLSFPHPPSPPKLSLATGAHLHRLPTGFPCQLVHGWLQPVGAPGELEGRRGCSSALSPLSGCASSSDGVFSKSPPWPLVPPDPGSLPNLWVALVGLSTLPKPGYPVPHVKYPPSNHAISPTGL